MSSRKPIRFLRQAGAVARTPCGPPANTSRRSRACGQWAPGRAAPVPVTIGWQSRSRREPLRIWASKRLAVARARRLAFRQ